MKGRLALVFTLLAAGCDSGRSGTSAQRGPSGLEPLGVYEAKTTGNTDQLLLHLDELVATYLSVSEPTPAQARKAIDRFTAAVKKTADAVLERDDLIPQQSAKAAEILLTALARRAQSVPQALDDLHIAAERIIQRYPGTQAATTACFVRVTAIVEAPNRRFGSLNERYDAMAAALTALGRCDPPHPRAPEMLAKFAVELEENGRNADALALYQVLVEKFPDFEGAKDAPNRIRQLQQEGTTVTDFRGKLLDGSEFDIEAHRGKIILVDFWASWCEPCLAALPHIRQLIETKKNRGLVVVGVDCDFSTEIGRSFIRRRNIDWPQIIEPATDDPTSLQYRFGASTLPVYLVIDREGRLVKSTRSGIVAWQTIDKLFAAETEVAKTKSDSEPEQPTPDP